ncbi:hypothetical protein ONZ45_g15117 [Pleurotus djamor]|nr:hypothetical protein ONZ45_g15117 [Pleurotus djamor]
MNAANKPVILEEFGILDGKTTTYASWFDTIYNSGLSGDLYWQAGSRYSWGSTHDDGYAIYPDSPEYPIIADHAADLKARPA